MKLKLNFGKGGLKGFIVQHAEKAIFGMVLVLVAVFVYSSATLETVDEGQSPSSLKGSAGGALKNLQNANAWAALGPERQRKVDNYPALATIAGTAVDPQPYTGDPWIKELFRRQQKRQDPAIVPARTGRGGSGCIRDHDENQEIGRHLAGCQRCHRQSERAAQAQAEVQEKAADAGRLLRHVRRRGRHVRRA